VAVQTDGDFREAGLPESIPIPITLPPSACVVIARGLWWLNWCDADETIAKARERASRGTGMLVALARQHGSVMLVGHGMFNRFLAALHYTSRSRAPSPEPRVPV
jgi:broad specificity phosphatase PhoE